MEAVFNNNFALSRNQIDKVFRQLVVAALVMLTLIQLSSVTYAAAGGLTDIFSTKSFQGSWEVINKFNWLGFAMNFIISAFCLIGLCLVFYQRMISMLYLSSRGVFDNVYDMKNAAKGGAFFGLPGMGRELYQGNRGVGLDSIIGLVYAFLPNIKAYSDYNPEKMSHNLQEDDNVATYMLKTLLPTVLLVFFFSIGFSGTLAKAYGQISNAMSAAADKAVTVNLEAYVNKVLNTGESYTFSIGDNQTAEGKLGEKIARDIYGKVLSRSGIIDTESRLIIGKEVEGWVWSELLNKSYGESAYTKLEELAGKNIGIKTDPDGKLVVIESAADVDALRYDIVVNTSESLGDAASDTTMKLTDFITGATTGGVKTGLSSGQVSGAPELYMHLTITKDKVTDANFFVRPGDAPAAK
jgi:hypothetical protein